jgi:hypothetical protein
MEAEQDDKPSLPYGSCAAYGCPLPGAIAQSQTGSDRWLCNIHFHAHSSNWNEITQRLHKRRVEVRLIGALRNALSGNQMDMQGTLEYLHATGNGILIPGAKDHRADGNLSMTLWLNRIEKLLAEDVTNGLVADVVSKKTSPDMLMDIAKEFLKKHAIGA